jgi:hypothetical protein
MPDLSRHPADERHEIRDVDRRRLFWFALGFATFIVAALGLLGLIFGFGPSGLRGPGVAGVPDSEVHERAALLEYQQAQRAALADLHWTDASRQFAKLPIEDAMALMAAHPRQLDADANRLNCASLATVAPRAAAATQCGDRP